MVNPTIGQCPAAMPVGPEGLFRLALSTSKQAAEKSAEAGVTGLKVALIASCQTSLAATMR